MKFRYWTGLALSGTVLADTIVTSNSAIANCPPLGAVLPPPKRPSSSTAVKEVLAQFETLQKEAGALLGNATGLSVSIASAYEDEVLGNLSYTPQLFNESGVHKVDGNTVFRIASVSKVMTVLGLLMLGDKISFSDPVTKYVPELQKLYKDPQNRVTAVNWDAVSLDALASQLSGVPDALGNDLANDPSLQLTQYGLPELKSNESSQCGDLPDQRGCTWDDFWNDMGNRAPIYAPYTTPAYGNLAYDILGLVIERVSGQSYGDYVQKQIFEPLNMTRTFVTTPDNSIGFISKESNWWATDFGIDQADGGLYSSANDLAKFGQGILNNKLIDDVKTRAWLKPHSHTSSLGISVGSPWEIARTNNLTVDGRIIDVYSKIGSVPDYNSIFMVIPDYGLTVSILSAGPQSNVGIQFGLATKVLQLLVRAFEAAGKEEATVSYAGTYANKETNSTIKLGIDNQSGLVVESWVMNGRDIKETYPAIASVSSNPPLSQYLSIRLFPTGLQSSTSSAWRAVFDTLAPAGVPQEDEQVFILQFACNSWETIDNVVYGYNALDDFVFELEPRSGTVAASITPRAFRQTLTRT
ncbi:beta-lactamase/transpeptidase-like protein [Aspergillus ambiguus]|uniref:serine hydrolase domain-containing protein n=1 Tax=Aspergillus ambiguus TaxID=176160 RepID=UPI003CCDF7CB